MTRRTLVSLTVLLLLVSACQATSQAPLLTDPREILTQTIGATSTVRTVHARVDVVVRMPQADPAGPSEQGGFGEIDLDLVNTELNAVIEASDGSGRSAFTLVDGTAFTQGSASGRWTKVPMVGGVPGLLGGGLFGGAPVPAPDVPKILAEAMADPATTIELRGVADCATGRCYQVAIALPPERVFKAVVSFTGMDQQPDFDEQAVMAGASVPGIGLELAVDTVSMRVVEATVSASLQGTAFAMRVQLSRFDEQLSIQAPPPALVDEPGAILEGVGQPIPVTPTP
jgi:hypothetical protein